MRLRIAAMILAVSLGTVSLASAQEPLNMFKWFSPTPAKSEPAKKQDGKTDMAPLADTSNFDQASKAKADLDRRQEVCLRLREIAIATKDEELLRMADMLDQRAFDLYIVSKNRSRLPIEAPPAPEAATAKKGGR